MIKIRCKTCEVISSYDEEKFSVSNINNLSCGSCGSQGFVLVLNGENVSIAKDPNETIRSHNNAPDFFLIKREEVRELVRFLEHEWVGDLSGLVGRMQAFIKSQNELAK